MKSLSCIFVLCYLAGFAQAETGLVREYVETNGVPQRISESPMAIGANYETEPPPVYAGYIFTHWTMNVEGATRDVLGRAYDRLPYHLTNRIDLTAHYLPSDQDSDGDGVADGYEIYWYGNLARGADSDTDGDGFTFAEELANGTNPLMADGEVEGSILYADGEMTLYNPNGYAQFTISSETEGLVTLVDQTCRPGTSVSTPTLSPTASKFAYWTRNGEPVRDELGRAIDGITLTIGEAVENFVAVGVADYDTRMKLYWYGDESVGMDSDTDGDGFTFAQELTNGTNPLMADGEVEGPVRFADAAELVLYNPYDYQPVAVTEADGVTVKTNSCELTRPGMAVSTGARSPMTSNFAYWTRNGVPCRDELGRALDEIVFMMGKTAENLEAVLVGDANARQKLYWYGTTEVSMESDTDGDGRTFAEEIAAGTNPLMADGDVEGPVQVADGRLLLYDPFGTLDVCVATATGYEGAYDGQNHGISVTVQRPTSGTTLRYGLSDSGPFSATMPTFKDVGTYVIWYEVAALDYETLVDCAEVKIVKGSLPPENQPDPVDPDPDDPLKPYSAFDYVGVYDGEGHTIDTNRLAAAYRAAVGKGFAVSYAIGENGGFIETALPWMDVAPVFTNAATNVVWYKVSSANYEDIVHPAKVAIVPRAMSSVSVSDPGVIDYTGMAITPSVTVSDGAPSIVKTSDYTISYADNVHPGTARIILTATATGNYTGTKTVPFTIRKTTFDIDDGTGGEGGKNSKFSYSGVYDGLGHGIDVQIANPPAGTVIKYSRGQPDKAPGGTWSTENPLYTNVCDNVVWYAVECAGYMSYTNNATVTITPKALTVKSANKSKTYDGTSLKLTAGDIAVGRAGSTNPPTGGGFVETALPAGESFVYGDLAERTEAGMSPATFTVAAGPGTDLANYTITTEYGTLTVTKATLDPGSVFPGLESWTEEDGFACTRVYNGKAQPFEVEVAEDFAEEYEFLYAVTPGAWSPVAPTRKDVAEGALKVYFRFVSPNFEPYEGFGTLRIVEKEITDEMVQPGEDAFFFDGDAKKPTVDVQYFVDGKDICKESDYTLAYGTKADSGWWVTVTGKGNYSGSVTKIVPVLKRPVAPPVVPSKSYNGKTQKPTIPTDDRWTVVANPGGINVGEYANVVLRLTNTSDYKWKGGEEDETDVTLVFRITKAGNGWSRQPGMKGWTYGEAPSEPAMGQPRYGTSQVAYRKAGADVSAETATRPELPGKYVARFWVAESENYAGIAGKEVAFEIVDPSGGGDITVTTPVPVPHDWLEPYLAQFGGDYEAAANAKGRNGVALWESYVAGLDPTDAASQFKVIIAMGADGKPVIRWEPDLRDANPPRVYVEYGKANLGDKEWAPVTDANRAAMRFFKVGVEIK